jgi:NitT/TauT family transport system permease protein
VPRIPRWLLALPLPVVLIGLWQLAVARSTFSLIPPPSTVALTAWDFAFGGIYDYAYSHTLLTHVAASLSRVFGGFMLAAVVAVPLGIVLGRSVVLARFVDPTLQFLRPVPVTAWLPLAMILFGVGPRAAVALIFIGTFFPILINTVDGVKYVEPRLIEAAEMLGTARAAILTRIVMPAALPSIFTGLRVSLGFAWVLVVVGEMTGVPQGLGAAIMDARNLSRTDLVIAGMFFIGILGFTSDRIVVAIGRRALWWNPSARG